MDIPFLNRLPKDLLISLVCYIESRLQKENAILRESIGKCDDGGLRVRKCAYSTNGFECTHLQIFDCNSYLYKETNTIAPGYICQECVKYFCGFHCEGFIVSAHKINSSWDCGAVCSNECLEKWTRPTNFTGKEEFDFIPISEYVKTGRKFSMERY